MFEIQNEIEALGLKWSVVESVSLQKAMKSQAEGYMVFVGNKKDKGFTSFTGSFELRKYNDLAGTIECLGHRVHFIHFRNTKRDA